MSLSLSLLGVFQASLNGQPITEFYSSKVRALLAYLAVEAGRVHSRPVLAALLWPDWADRAALGNLRFSLSKLRQVINDQDSTPSFLLINRDTVQLNPAAELSLDVRLFQQEVQASRWEAADVDGQPEPVLRSALGRLTTAIDLYRGSFLEGFSAGDSGAFEEWALIKREELEREARSALHGLTALHSRLGDYAAAERCVHRLLEMDPWDELANRRLMSVLLQNGQRNAALRHYTAYREALAKELGAEPAEETVAHYELIRGGQPGRATGAESPGPPPIARRSSPPSAAGPARTFVARESQLALLDGYLDQALAGQGVVAFVSGEAGSGKTVLLGQFARRALTQHRDLLAAGGNCNAYTGLGDPYLPFCEIAQALAGRVEAQHSGNEAIDAHVRRSQDAARVAATALAEKAPDLVDRFIFTQYTDFLIALSRVHPLLLILDDLQWADNGSLSLLFHLGRRLGGVRILIVGAYRPEEVAAGRGGARHPLATIVNELRQVYGSAEIDLDQADGWRFVTAMLDNEAGHPGASFRDALYRLTGGHPLFTVELLRDLQQRGELAPGATGAWAEATAVSWDRLPPRVEAVIAERIQRLPPDAQALLAAASVEGEEFTAEAVAEVVQMEISAVVGRLSDLLGKQHRLVRGTGVVLAADATTPLSRYRFQHALVQQYIYARLDPVQRRHLQGSIDAALERLYARHTASGAGGAGCR